MSNRKESIIKLLDELLREEYGDNKHYVITDLDRVRIRVKNGIVRDLPGAAKLLGVEYLIYPSLGEVTVTDRLDVIIESVPFADLSEIVYCNIDDGEILTSLSTGLVGFHKLISRIEEVDPNLALAIREGLSAAKDISLRHGVNAILNISGFKLTLLIKLVSPSVALVRHKDFKEKVLSIIRDLEEKIRVLQLLAKGLQPNEIFDERDV